MLKLESINAVVILCYVLKLWLRLDRLVLVRQ